jgi:hypothetical protein
MLTMPSVAKQVFICSPSVSVQISACGEQTRMATWNRRTCHVREGEGEGEAHETPRVSVSTGRMGHRDGVMEIGSVETS